jgi:hypothetical protein
MVGHMLGAAAGEVLAAIAAEAPRFGLREVRPDSARARRGSCSARRVSPVS